MNDTSIVANVHDARYQFELTRSDRGPGRACIVIRQVGTPPGNPPLFNPSIWGQWLSAKTTEPRSVAFLERLRTRRPATKWFQRHVNWVY